MIPTPPLTFSLDALSEVLDAASLMLLVFDGEGRILRANRHACERLGYAVEDLIGLDSRALEIEGGDADLTRALGTITTSGPMSHETVLRTREGGDLPVEASLSQLGGQAGDQAEGLAVAILRDLSELQAMERLHERSLLFDALTGLRNRNGLTALLNGLRRGESDRPVEYVLACLDLDEFAAINESFGYRVGDDFMKHVAARITSILGPGEAAARIGADEIAVVKAGAGEADVDSLAQRLSEAMEAPFVQDDIPLRLTACIGVGLRPAHGTTPEEVLRAADAALSDAKRIGNGQCRVFHPTMQRSALQRVSLQAKLGGALRRNEFSLNYQPYFSIVDGALLGCEALIRWNDGVRWISPADFIPVAERSDTIVDLGEWVINEVCRQIGQWSQFGFNCPRVSLNVSGVQIRRAAVESQLRAAFARHGTDPEQVCVELTESSLMETVGGDLSKLGRIRDTGVRLAIDDFGTGFSSLSYLTRMPVSTLKIDRSFIDPLLHDGGASALVTNAIVRLAQSLDLQVIAEGVEHNDQLDYLREIGCDAMQGYLRSKPIPPDEFALKFLAGAGEAAALIP